jgi:hypothetical protein
MTSPTPLIFRYHLPLSRRKWCYAPLVRLYHSKMLNKLGEPPIYYSGSNEPSLASLFKRLENTFKNSPSL